MSVKSRLNNRHHLTVVGQRIITLGGNQISYTIKRSSVARYARLEFKSDGLLSVIIPSVYQLERVPGLLELKKSWIERHIKKQDSLHPQRQKMGIEFGDGLRFFGREIYVTESSNKGCRASIVLLDNKLLVSDMCSRNHLTSLIEAWYRTQASSLIKQKAAEMSVIMGVQFRRLSIRGQRTRWGSCSKNKTLSFNWKLMMMPENIINYVVWHELAHLKEMNHSKKFWSLVEKHCCEYQAYRKWLRINGTQITSSFSSYLENEK